MARPPLDPEIAAVLERAPALSRSVTADDVPAMRAAQAAGALRPSDDALRCGGAVKVEERTLPGAGLKLLVLRPAGHPGPSRGVLYLHGGGFVAGDERTGLQQVRPWVTELGLTVASPAYRLAPEHRYPAAADDAFAVAEWVTAHAGELGVDDWMLAGASAGGGLAAAVALMARDHGGPELSRLILLSPMLDDRCETPSSHELDGDAPWDRRSNLTAWDALLGDARGGPDVDAYAAPARADDLAGMPPTYLDVGAVETLRDEVVDFARRLDVAGVETELHVWEGACHGFDVFAPDSRVARAATAARADYLQRTNNAS